MKKKTKKCHCGVLIKDSSLSCKKHANIHTKEWREKVSLKMKGRKFTVQANNKGRVHSLQSRLNMSIAHKGQKPWNTGKKRPEISGENSHMWKGGITPINKQLRNSLEYKLLRESVFKRDNYTCIWCGSHGVTLNADHIKLFALYPELRFAIDNGRTFCILCHEKTDTYKGKTKRI